MKNDINRFVKKETKLLYQSTLFSDISSSIAQKRILESDWFPFFNFGVNWWVKIQFLLFCLLNFIFSVEDKLNLAWLNCSIYVLGCAVGTFPTAIGSHDCAYRKKTARFLVIFITESLIVIAEDSVVCLAVIYGLNETGWRWCWSIVVMRYRGWVDTEFDDATAALG